MYKVFSVILVVIVYIFCKRDLMVNVVSFLYLVDLLLIRVVDIGIKNIFVWLFKMFYKKDRYICIIISIKLLRIG